MQENQFIVDLGDIKLSATERLAINKSIQVAASIELAKIKSAQNAKLLEVNKGKVGLKLPPKGTGPKLPPIYYGMIVIRKPFWDKWLNDEIILAK